jgi:hypothetical protein
VFALPLPAITAVGTVLTCSISNATYQWYFNGTLITGATQQSYTALQNGNYTVSVVDVNGCGGTSAAVTVSGITSVVGIKVFPVPTSGKIYITATNIKGTATVKIFNSTGALMMEKAITDMTLKNEIDIRLLAGGMYELKLFTDAGTFVKKIQRF